MKHSSGVDCLIFKAFLLIPMMCWNTSNIYVCKVFIDRAPLIKTFPFFSGMKVKSQQRFFTNLGTLISSKIIKTKKKYKHMFCRSSTKVYIQETLVLIYRDLSDLQSRTEIMVDRYTTTVVLVHFGILSLTGYENVHCAVVKMRIVRLWKCELRGCENTNCAVVKMCIVRLWKCALCGCKNTNWIEISCSFSSRYILCIDGRIELFVRLKPPSVGW